MRNVKHKASESHGHDQRVFGGQGNTQRSKFPEGTIDWESEWPRELDPTAGV